MLDLNRISKYITDASILSLIILWKQDAIMEYATWTKKKEILLLNFLLRDKYIYGHICMFFNSERIF